MKNRFEKLSAPDFIKYPSAHYFIDENHQKEWDEADENVKRSVLHYLKNHAEDITNTRAIEYLALILIDMQERLDKLEKDAEV